MTGLAKLFGVVPLIWLKPPTFTEAKLAEGVKAATSAVTLVPYGMVTPIVPDAPLTIWLEPICPGEMKVAASVFTLVKEGLVTPAIPPLTIVLKPTCPGILYAVISAALLGATVTVTTQFLEVVPSCDVTT